ncbi:MAG: hypothetical protein CBC19_09490 [Oceanospirillales bacterium TMED59]|nr:MAG: hypothetical protein CBC19_09490 [Oceanospirillales bacterium TMED59]
MRASYKAMSPFMTSEEAATMLRIAEERRVFRTYAEEALNDGIGESLPQRFDAAFNYIQHGIDGHGNSDDVSTAAQRTNYFRETYAYGNDIKAAGVEAFFNHPDLLAVAGEVTGRSLVVPAIVYANILTPGQELAIHTDVPEFRGADRKRMPQWLLVTMLHSGLFDDYRIPIATCVSWFGANPGGAFAYYPEGPHGRRESMPASHNTAILIDTDKVFHGVERVTPKSFFPEIDKGATLTFEGSAGWSLAKPNQEVVARYQWEDLRYSISWKAYCFAAEAEKAKWANKTDDLTLDFILDTLESELRSRGVLQGERPDPTAFAQALVNEFIRFPAAEVA